MSKERFEHLHSLVEPLIKKQDTRFRKPIPARERLVVTLCYLSSRCPCSCYGCSCLVRCYT